MQDMPRARPPEPAGEAPRPRVWSVGLALAALYSGLIGLGLLVFAAGGAPDRLSSLLAIAGLSTSWIGLVALGAGLLSSEPLLRRLGLVRPRLDGVGWLVAIVGGLAASQAADLLLRLSGAGRGAALGRVLSLLAAARGAQLALALLVLGLCAGIAEELFFRGYVQRRLAARFGGVAGIVLAAAFFALAHFDPHHSAFAFVFGVYVGAIAAWCRSTGPAIVIHVVNNMVAVLLVAGGIDDARAATSPGALAVQLLVAAAITVVCAAWIRHRARPAALDDFAGARVGSAL